AQPADLEQEADLVLRRPLEDRRLRLEAEQLADPAEVRLQDLADVHPARHAERVQDDLDRRAVRQEGHVLLRDDPRHDPLVPVTARHLVADADLALLGDVDLDELDHARRELVRLEDLVDLVLDLLADTLDPPLRLIDDETDPLTRIPLLDLERRQIDLGEVDLRQDLVGQAGPLLEVRLDGPALQHQGDRLAAEQLEELLVPRLADPRDLLALVPPELADARAALLLQERIIDPAAEDLDVDDRALHPR